MQTDLPSVLLFLPLRPGLELGVGGARLTALFCCFTIPTFNYQQWQFGIVIAKVATTLLFARMGTVSFVTTIFA
jgi:hypothetical protein